MQTRLILELHEARGEGAPVGFIFRGLGSLWSTFFHGSRGQLGADVGGRQGDRGSRTVVAHGDVGELCQGGRGVSDRGLRPEGVRHVGAVAAEGCGQLTHAVHHVENRVRDAEEDGAAVVGDRGGSDPFDVRGVRCGAGFTTSRAEAHEFFAGLGVGRCGERLSVAVLALVGPGDRGGCTAGVGLQDGHVAVCCAQLAAAFSPLSVAGHARGQEVTSAEGGEADGLFAHAPVEARVRHRVGVVGEGCVICHRHQGEEQRSGSDAGGCILQRPRRGTSLALL